MSSDLDKTSDVHQLSNQQQQQQQHSNERRRPLQQQQQQQQQRRRRVNKRHRVSQCLDELKNLTLATNKFKIKKILKSCPAHLIDAISEISLNVLKNKVQIDEPTFSKLKRFKKVLRELAKRKNSNVVRRSLIVNQRGGSIIPLLVSAALPLITKLFV